MSKTITIKFSDYYTAHQINAFASAISSILSVAGMVASIELDIKPREEELASAIVKSMYVYKTGGSKIEAIKEFRRRTNLSLKKSFETMTEHIDKYESRA